MDDQPADPRVRQRPLGSGWGLHDARGYALEATRDLLKDMQAEAILAMPADELLADARAEGRDPTKFAAEMRAWVKREIQDIEDRRAQE